MARVFFPSCKTKLYYPEACEKLLAYMTTVNPVDQVIDCCLNERAFLTSEDTAVVICNTCTAFIDESSNVGQTISVWEVIDADPDFAFPDYQGQEITIQDCWRVAGKHEVHDAIRSLLKKMNITAVELPENRDDCMFCGVTLHEPLGEYFLKSAPARFSKGVEDGLFVACSEEECANIMKEYVDKIQTSAVVSYCIGCDQRGLALTGIDSRSMMELIFN